MLVFGADIRGDLLLFSLQIKRCIVGRRRKLSQLAHYGLVFLAGGLDNSVTWMLQVVGTNIRTVFRLLGLRLRDGVVDRPSSTWARSAAKSDSEIDPTNTSWRG